jgi:hypothetical protein
VNNLIKSHVHPLDKEAGRLTLHFENNSLCWHPTTPPVSKFPSCRRLHHESQLLLLHHIYAARRVTPPPAASYTVPATASLKIRHHCSQTVPPWKMGFFHLSCLRSGIDGSLPSLLAAPAAGGGGETCTSCCSKVPKFRNRSTVRDTMVVQCGTRKINVYRPDNPPGRW